VTEDEPARTRPSRVLAQDVAARTRPSRVLAQQQSVELRLRGTMADLLGFELLDLDPQHARGSFEVVDAVRQPLGVVHGGAYAAFAETIASTATYMAVAKRGNIAMGQANDTSFLRPVGEGTVHADARLRHRGRTTWVWDVEFTDDEGRLCAVTRVTIAVRPRPS
jgi:1,4-dihydroxy-2-naphthoyl-CoA hydrolase